MEIKFTTNYQSQYLYKIIRVDNNLPFKARLETLSGDRNPEFTLDAVTAEQCINELEAILSEKGLKIMQIDDVINLFHPNAFFQQLVDNLV